MQDSLIWEAHERRYKNSIGETLTQGAVTLEKYRNVRIDKIGNTGMFKQVLCQEVMLTLAECSMGMEIMSVLYTVL